MKFLKLVWVTKEGLHPLYININAIQALEPAIDSDFRQARASIVICGVGDCGLATYLVANDVGSILAVLKSLNPMHQLVHEPYCDYETEE